MAKDGGLDQVGGRQAEEGRQEQLIYEHLGGDGCKIRPLAPEGRKDAVEDEVLRDPLVRTTVKNEGGVAVTAKNGDARAACGVLT